ncbi:unnamed protein product [Camellia sinensis]
MKRHSTSSHDNSVSKFSGTRILYDGQSIERRPNAALFLEDIKQEVESFDFDQLEGTPAKTQSALWRKSLAGDAAADSIRRPGSYSLKSCKHEDDALSDGGDTTFTLFASLLDSALQVDILCITGLMPIPNLILQFERSCRNVSESIRCGSNERHRIGEDKLKRQKARLLLDEAASWSLLWRNEELPEDLMLVRGSHVGTYLPSSGVWHHTQRVLKKGVSKPKTVHHLDFDAPTHEHAEQLPDDKKQDESLLEDVWALLRAGRLEEACDLCRSAGQPWRAATLCPFGGLDLCPSVEALVKNGNNRTLQAIELESGIGHQWRLWKWATYCVSERIAEQDGGKYETAVYAAKCSNLKCILPICTDWELACWAMAKSWLDVQVDLELVRLPPGGMDQFKTYEDAIDRSHGQGDSVSPSTVGPENWPVQVLNQQPRHLSALLQKLHSSDSVHEAITQECKEQHRQIEMNLMMGDIPHLLDVIWSWISPSEDEENVFRPHGDPQMIRFGAHLVLVLRYLWTNEGCFQRVDHDCWISWMRYGFIPLKCVTYAIFLFSTHCEELVGIYASQLAHHRCIDLFVHMMELRLNSSRVTEVLMITCVHDERASDFPFQEKQQIVCRTGRENAVLPTILDTQKDYKKILKYEVMIQKAVSKKLLRGFCQDLRKSNLENMINRLMLLSNIGCRVFKRLWSYNGSALHLPPLLMMLRLLVPNFSSEHCYTDNILFREFALISMWRVPAMPIGAHTLLSFLAEPLKQPTETLLSTEDHDVSENLRDEYYSCDATYRNWLKVELENVEVSPLELSVWVRGVVRGSPGRWRALQWPEITGGGEEEVKASLERERVSVSISSTDNYCIEVVLRCLATDGDGLGPHELNDGGILATVIAAGFKERACSISSWCNSGDLTIRCLVFKQRWFPGRPSYIHREGPLSKVSVSLVELGNPPESHDELIELVASPETGFLHLFSQQQLQEN